MNLELLMKYPIKLFLLFFLFSFLLVHVQAGDVKQKKRKDEKEKVLPAGTSTAAVAILIDAKKEEITGNPKKAMELYREYIGKYPDGATGHYELGRMLAENRQYDEALKYAVRAAELEPGNRWYRLFLAQTYQMKGDYREAITVYHDLTKEFPDELDNFYNLASVYLITGRYREAIGIYDQIEKRTGISEEMSLQKEKIFLEMKDEKSAQAELEKLVAAYPANTKYLSVLAQFYMESGQPVKAFDTYQKILSIDPGNPYIHISLAEYYAKTGDREKAFLELKEGFSNPGLDIDTKINILFSFYSANEVSDQYRDQSEELTGILARTHPEDPKSYSIRGDFFVQDKKYAQAREQFLKVISLDSSKYVVWEQLLQLDLQLEKFSDLEVHSRKTIELFPEMPVPYLFSGITNYQLKKHDMSVSMLERGLKLVVNNDKLLAQFYMNLGDAYHALKKEEESDKSYERSLQLDGDNAYVLNNYSYYLSLRGIELKKAEEMAKKAVVLDSLNSAFQDTYGWVLYKLGRFPEAKEWIGKAVEGDPEGISAVVLEHYGDVWYRLGDTEKAFDYWQKAKARGEGSAFLDRKIAEKKLIE